MIRAFSPPPVRKGGLRALALAPIILAAAPAARAQDITGEWARGDGQAQVRIAPCGGALCAINTWIRDASSSEKVGDRLQMKVEPIGAAEMTGEAFDPQRNLTYRIEITVASARRMTTRGCVLGGLLCKSVAWTRLK